MFYIYKFNINIYFSKENRYYNQNYKKFYFNLISFIGFLLNFLNKKIYEKSFISIDINFFIIFIFT